MKMIFCRMRRPQLQNLLEKMEEFINQVNHFETKILQKYVEKCSILHIGTTVWVYFTSISFIIGPLFLPQTFPTDAIYPFSTEEVIMKIFIYMHQSLVALQTSAAVLLDCLVAFFLWFTTARFEMLANSMDDFNSVSELRRNLITYRKLLGTNK
ncbi:uncharacterized protein LOC106655913 [Trichogramma pretiosum]|uniref:uncharacterized protein LOC106655913 n=1 Tax=Trichogramma pretiosum TaxID=7493 RepID=UPI0006C97108|nr:uncharacterized protein LOC106655913 [Trichogramma pretiosum]